MINLTRFLSSLLFGTVYFAAASAMIILTRFDGGVAFLWVASSLLIAHLAIRPRRRWLESLLPCAIASVLATGLFGLGWKLAVPFAAINMIEGLLAAYALRRSRHQLRPLGSLVWLLQFVVAVGFAGPLVAAALAASVLGLAGLPVHANFWTFFCGHALGNITFTPLALLALRGDLITALAKARRRDVTEIVLLVLGGSAITMIVFVQKSMPLLFLPILPVMIATFRFGRAGAAAGIAILAVIGGMLTATHHGPLQLIDASHGQRLIFFQFYLAMTVMTILPVAADLNRRARLLREVRLNGERFRLLADHSTDILMHLEVDGRIRFVSPSVRQLGGYDPADLVGGNCMVMIAPHYRAAVRQEHLATIAARGSTHSFEYMAITADGDQRWFETHGRAILDDDGEIDGVLSVVRDISARKATEARLSEAAMTDPLTGLANRRAFYTLINKRKLDGDESRDAIAIIDIDHFKQVNDRFGHDAGDEVLRIFAVVARRMVRHGDVVARIGGEEFALLFPDSSIDQALLICDRLRAEMAATTISVAGSKVGVTISGGVAPLGPDGLDHALRIADEALYRAKNAGRDQLALAA